MDESYQKLLGMYILGIFGGFAFPIYHWILESGISPSLKLSILIIYVLTLGLGEELVRRHFKITKKDKPPIDKPDPPIVPPP